MNNEFIYQYSCYIKQGRKRFLDWYTRIKPKERFFTSFDGYLTSDIGIFNNLPVKDTIKYYYKLNDISKYQSLNLLLECINRWYMCPDKRQETEKTISFIYEDIEDYLFNDYDLKRCKIMDNEKKLKSIQGGAILNNIYNNIYSYIKRDTDTAEESED